MKNTKSTEVKFTLDSKKALINDFEICNELIDFFDIDSEGKPSKIWYLDTDSIALHHENWIVRFRFLEGEDFELTFKKRFSKNEFETLSLSDDIKDYKDFELEIDKSFSKSVYSLSFVKLFALTSDLFNLDSKTAKNIAIDCAPGALLDFKKRNFGLQKLDKSLLYGPANAIIYKGLFDDKEVTLEVWKLDEYLTEVSADVVNSECEEFHASLLHELQKMHIILPSNTLKTDAFFNFYSEHPPLSEQ